MTPWLSRIDTLIFVFNQIGIVGLISSFVIVSVTSGLFVMVQFNLSRPLFGSGSNIEVSTSSGEVGVSSGIVLIDDVVRWLACGVGSEAKRFM